MILEFLLSAYECTQHGLIYFVLKLLSLPNIVIDDYYCYLTNKIFCNTKTVGTQ